MLVQEWTHGPMKQNLETDPGTGGHLIYDNGHVSEERTSFPTSDPECIGYSRERKKWTSISASRHTKKPQKTKNPSPCKLQI